MQKTISILAYTALAHASTQTIDPGTIAIAERDLVICTENAGKSDDTTEKLAKNMESFFKGIPKGVQIGRRNFPKVGKWLACLTRYSSVGGDEELGYASSLCDTFQDSRDFRFYLRSKSLVDSEIRDFRKSLILYSKNTGVDCR